MTASLTSLLYMDNLLATKGHPRIFAPGSWWHEQAAAFYAHPTAKEWWARVGRGGAKSTVMYRIALNETIAGDWVVPPGERHWAVIKSRSVAEAEKGLAYVAKCMFDLGVLHKVAGDTVEMTQRPHGVRVVAASIGAASGWRAYFDGCDELAKWPSEGSLAVDAREVISSGRAMCVTHPGARRLYFSSPFGVIGPHYDTIEAGTTDATFVSIAPSWVANPKTLSEESTHLLERDSRVWAREYAAIPSASGETVFDVDWVDFAIRERDQMPSGQASRSIVVIDPSSGGGDFFAWARVRRVGDMIAVDQLGGVKNFAQRMRMDDVVNHVARLAHACGASEILSDQRESSSLEALFRQHDLRMTSLTWTSSNKPGAVELLRRWFAERHLAIERNIATDELRRQLLQFTEKFAPSGQHTYGGRGNANDDFVAVLITTCLADMADLLPFAPGARSNVQPRVLPSTKFDDQPQGFDQLGSIGGGPAPAPELPFGLAVGRYMGQPGSDPRGPARGGIVLGPDGQIIHDGRGGPSPAALTPESVQRAIEKHYAGGST